LGVGPERAASSGRGRDEVGEVAYYASCFRSHDFGEEVAK
jgi:hypothetical protein